MKLPPREKYSLSAQEETLFKNAHTLYKNTRSKRNKAERKEAIESFKALHCLLLEKRTPPTELLDYLSSRIKKYEHPKAYAAQQKALQKAVEKQDSLQQLREDISRYSITANKFYDNEEYASAAAYYGKSIECLTKTGATTELAVAYWNKALALKKCAEQQYKRQHYAVTINALINAIKEFEHAQQTYQKPVQKKQCQGQMKQCQVRIEVAEDKLHELFASVDAIEENSTESSGPYLLIEETPTYLPLKKHLHDQSTAVNPSPATQLNPQSQESTETVRERMSIKNLIS